LGCYSFTVERAEPFFLVSLGSFRMYFIQQFVGVAQSLFWPIFLVGAIILHARTQSTATLLVLSGVVAACVGALMQYLSQFAVVHELLGAGGPPIGQLLRAVGYMLFVCSFIWYARSQPQSPKPSKSRRAP
jgi:hypothetical protein